MTPVERWNDDRLDDLAAQVKTNTNQLLTLGDIRGELIDLRGQMRAMGEDSHECLTDLRQLKKDLDLRAIEQHKERKADRKWVVATALTTAGLIIAALAIFLG